MDGMGISIVVVHRARVLRNGQTGLQGLLRLFPSAHDVVVHMREGDTGVRRGRTLTDRDGGLEQLACFDVAGPGEQ